MYGEISKPIEEKDLIGIIICAEDNPEYPFLIF